MLYVLYLNKMENKLIHACVLMLLLSGSWSFITYQHISTYPSLPEPHLPAPVLCALAP